MGMGPGPPEETDSHSIYNKSIPLQLIWGFSVTVLSTIPIVYCYICMIKCKNKVRTRVRVIRNTVIEEIDSLPRVRDTCPICLEEFQRTDTVRNLNCSHSFHKKCIDPWLINYKIECPMCRQAITENP